MRPKSFNSEKWSSCHNSTQVKYTYYNNLDKLQKETFDQAVGFQISRASYLELCNRTEGRIDAIADSRTKAAKLDKHLNEKMDFFAAVEEVDRLMLVVCVGKIVLGDTLLHVAVRLGHVEIIGYWLDNGLKENVPNFRGEFAHQVCTHPAIQLLMDDVVLVHDVLGFDYEDEAKMFDTTETALLVKVVGDVRSSHPFLNKYLKIANTLADRYRSRVIHLCLPVAIDLLRENDTKAYDAKKALLAWPTTDKLHLMWDVRPCVVLQQLFWITPAWLTLSHRCSKRRFPSGNTKTTWKRTSRTSYDPYTVHHSAFAVLNPATLNRFVEDAMSACIAMADDLRLYHRDAAPVTSDVLQTFDRQIWKARLAPDADAVDDLCAHIDGVQAFVRATNLKA
ncbi:hypothetical protein AaE_004373 [Aphanomyces astaci]|uniref:Uncharacterized protein n=2 Tax=Aphanomyces astaci TaxID=112090 RepID=A0A6A5AJE6_APHAT|nr:hypothetical protein AaE_004373 [Aphanomyces astaci]